VVGAVDPLVEGEGEMTDSEIRDAFCSVLCAVGWDADTHGMCGCFVEEIEPSELLTAARTLLAGERLSREAVESLADKLVVGDDAWGWFVTGIMDTQDRILGPCESEKPGDEGETVCDMCNNTGEVLGLGVCPVMERCPRGCKKPGDEGEE
jgi:hypothetical protein